MRPWHHIGDDLFFSRDGMETHVQIGTPRFASYLCECHNAGVAAERERAALLAEAAAGRFPDNEQLMAVLHGLAEDIRKGG